MTQVSPLQSPHSCSLPPKLLGKRKCSNAKAQRVTVLGPRLLFAPQIRYTTIRTRLAICHAHGELERNTGGSQWPPDQPGRQRAENAAHNSSAMLPAAVPACLVRAGAAVFPISNTGVGWPQILQGERGAAKDCSRPQQSKAQILAKVAANQLLAAAQGPPACLAASESRNSDGLLQRHNSRCWGRDGQCFQ